MKKLFALCWLLLVGCAQNTPSSPVPIQLNTNWSSGTLENGLKYHLYPMDSKEVSIRLLVHVGSTAEESSQLGYAHYVEHLAFEGSENFTPKEVERLMETTGAKSGTVLMLQRHTTIRLINSISRTQKRLIRLCYGFEM